MQATNGLLTIEEAAQALSVKPKTVRAWIAARRIAVVRPMGWAVRVPASEVKRIVEHGTTPALEEQCGRSDWSGK